MNEVPSSLYLVVLPFPVPPWTVCRQDVEERLRHQHHMDLHALRDAHRQSLETLKQQSEQELQTLRFELEDEGKAMLGNHTAGPSGNGPVAGESQWH